MTTSPITSITDELLAELELCALANAGFNLDQGDVVALLALLAERAELKRDAERYQFIANTCEVILHGKEIEDGDELDAAMQEAKP